MAVLSYVKRAALLCLVRQVDHRQVQSLRFLVLLVGATLLIATEVARAGSEQETAQADLPPRLATSYFQLPLSFEPNQGQTHSNIDFLSRGEGYTLFLTPTEAVLTLRRPSSEETESRTNVVRIQLVGGNRNAKVEGLSDQPGKSNYFVGNDQDEWLTDVRHFGRVLFRQVYPGIDLVYYGNQRRLEYDFVVSPGVDPTVIQIRVEGTDSLSLDEGGNLILHTPDGEVIQHAPIVYQEIEGERHTVSGQYLLQPIGKGYQQIHSKLSSFRFEIGLYDTSESLVIDPILSYSTYLGGLTGNETGQDIAVDDSGNIYVTGTTNASTFPTENPYQASRAGLEDAFVTKLSPTGSALIWSTYLGGSLAEESSYIDIDASGNVYLTGSTSSTDFPLVSPIQSSHAGGSADLFIAKLNAAGSNLLFSTYLGGSGSDDPWAGIVADAAFGLAVAGATFSTDFPTVDPYQGTNNGGADGFLLRISNTYSLTYSTYFGGSSEDEIRGLALVPGSDLMYVGGHTQSTDFPLQDPIQSSIGGSTDAFAAKFTAVGDLDFSTYLGGSGDEWTWAVTADASGGYYAGQVGSADFPIQSAYQASLGGGMDGFITKLDAAGTALIYSTYLGGTGTDFVNGIAVDGSQNVYVTGQTTGSFPLQSASQNNYGGGTNDAFVANLNASGSALVYSTYLGGTWDDIGRGIVVDASGNPYVTGETQSFNFPTKNPYQAYKATIPGLRDAFVSKLGPIDTDGSLTSASGVLEPVALPSTSAHVDTSVSIFDFTLSDGGTSDGEDLSVSQIILHTSGSGPFSKVQFRLTGPETSSNGTYDGGSNTITFSDLPISVAHGTSETFTVNAYYTDNTGLSEGQTLVLSVDGDVDLTGFGTEMSGSNEGVSNEAGTTVLITATHLAFSTQPPVGAFANVDFVGSVVVQAQDAVGNVDIDFAESVTLASVLSSDNTILGSGTLSSTDTGGLTKVASSGTATWEDLKYDAANTIDLRVTSASYTTGSGDEAYSTSISLQADTDGTLTAAGGVTEPAALPSTATGSGSAVDIFDFTLSDGGAADGLALGVSQAVLHTSGSGPFSQVIFRLNGPDATNVTGTYNGGANTITFSSLPISVAHGASETYTVNAYYNDNSGLTEAQTLVLSIDGDIDLSVSGTLMTGSNAAITNGTGSTVSIAATHLAFTTQPPASSYPSADFAGLVAIQAQDGAGNVDADFSESVTLAAVLTSNNATLAGGSLSSTDAGGLTKTAAAGSISWTDLRYDAIEQIDLRATSASFTAGSGDEGYSSAVSVTTDTDGSFTIAGGVSEPVPIPSTATTAGAAVDILDFTISDGGASDGLPLDISQIVMHTSGTGPYSKAAFRLDGPDVTQVAGVYSGGSNTITFSGLNISIPNGANETYLVNAYFNDNTGLTDNQTFILSFDGDVDVTVTGLVTQMSGASPVITNGSGSIVDIAATQLAYSTQPPAVALPTVDFTGTVTIEARDAASNVDVNFSESITLSAMLSSNNSASSSGTLSSTDAGGVTKNPSGGSVTWTDVSYDTNESIDLRGTSASFPAGSGFEAYSTAINVASDTDGTLTANTGVTEPVVLPSTAASPAAAVNIFDFTLNNGAAADGLPLALTQIVLHTSGTGPFAKVAFRLNGPDAVNVVGAYSGGTNTLTFSGLSISVSPTTSETYTLDAHYNDNTGLTEGQTLIFSVDGDVDLTMATASSRMSGSNAAITNGSGSAVDIAATHLAFGTEPPASAVINNDFTGIVMIEALDAAGNLDTDFTEAVTLAPVVVSDNTIDASGTLSSSDAGGLTKSASAGQTSWTNLIHGVDQDVDLRATSATFVKGSGNEAYSTKVEVQADGDGQVVAAPVVGELVGLPSSAGQGSPVDVFDFTLIDGGTADLATLEVSNIDLLTSGTVPFPNIQFWLNGPDAVNVPGTYNAGTNEVNFSLNISVPNGGSETYTVSVNFEPATGLSDSQSLTLTIANNQITTAAGTMMSGSGSPLTGVTPVEVTADRLQMTGFPSSALANSDFAGSLILEAVDVHGNVDADFEEDVTLSLGSSPSGTLSSLDAGGLTRTASNGSVTWTDLRYIGAGSIQLYASSPSFVIGSGQQGSSSPITVTAASGGILIESPGIVEPTPLPSTARSMSVSAGVFDFTITDGGLEGLNLDVSEVIVHTAGDGPFGDVAFFLSGIGAPNVVGTFDAVANTLTFSSLLISVGDGQSHTFTVGAYYNVNPHALTGSAFQLSVNGDTDLTVSASGSQMSGSSTTVDNGSGALVDLTPTNAKIRDVFSVDLPSTVVSISDPAPTFQIVFEDEGGDGFPYLIEEMVFHTSGPLDKVTLLLDGPDESERFQFSGTKAAASPTTGVAGTYDAATSTLTYSGLTISVGDGSIETYSINAFFHDNIGLVDGETIELSFDTFVDITTPFSGSTGRPATR